MKRRRTAFALALWLSLSVLTMPAYRGGALASSAEAEAKASEMAVAGLRGNVTVRRDRLAIPYIEASNLDDLYIAQGYVAASDRLWQMDLLRRTARGELSEILGSAALEEDKRHRAFRFGPLAQQMVERLSPPMRAALEAYAKGVNAFIESLDAVALPPEFRVLQYKPRPWTPADSLVISKLLAETLTTSWPIDMMRAALAGLPADRRAELLPRTSPLDVLVVGSDESVRSGSAKSGSAQDRPTESGRLVAEAEMMGEVARVSDVMRRSLERIGLYSEDLAASNNWVVSGRLSVTGKPLLANDPHLSPSAPSIWYMVHLTAPGLHVAGVTIAGEPGVIIGHNDHIAWGITNVEADVEDLYAEKFDGINSRRYLTPGGWREAEVSREVIAVRKSPADPATQPTEFNVTVTRHGPVILEKDGLRYALSWPALDPASNEIEVYYFINRAQDWQEFRAALSRYMGFPLNIVYADVEGHIGYWAAGRYPVRKTGRGSLPYDGSSGEGDWQGYVPFEATPHVYDPPSGLIITANNRTIGTDYPYYITDNWAPPYRARRIYDLLTSRKKLSVEDFRTIQADTYSFPDAAFLAEIVKLGRPLESASPEWREVLAAFAGWDAMLAPDSQAMALCVTMRAAFQRRVLAGAIGEEVARKYNWANAGTFFDRIIRTRPREWLPTGFDSYEALLLASYKDAIDTLTRRLGPDRSRWTWGRLTQVRFQHPLASAPLVGAQFEIAPFPQNGGGQAVNRGASVSMRFLADLSDWDNTRQGVPLGESGNPASPHWKDQLESWRSMTPPTFPFNKDAVAAAAKETLILTVPHT